MKKVINIACCLLPALSAVAVEADSLSVIDRTATALRGHRTVFEQSYDNPAVKQWMLPTSYSTLALSYDHNKQNTAVNPQLGDGSNIAAFNADAYIKHGTSTLWGRAYYNNGKQYNIECNESADAALIYPYFTTDEIGGDMNVERYYFGGGFADTRGNWAWGGSLSYLAGLYYRSVDPRPRNVTGTLDASLGAAYRFVADYYGGVSVNFRKYKQSNDIEFVSEMGSSVIYHATGLGTHYNRFAGTGDAAYYNGYRYGATANIYPASGSGFVASVGVSRFTFNKILTDLNRLPLCSVWHNALNAQAGYSTSVDNHTAAVAVNYDFYRRHGKENIFGDASASVYPQIGYLEMYADNYYAVSLSGLYEWQKADKGMVSVKPKVGYSHDRQVYADPRRDWLINSLNVGADVKCAYRPTDLWLVALNLGIDYVKPLDSPDLAISDVSDSEKSLVSVTERSFRYASNNQTQFLIGAAITCAISSKYALQLGVDYSRTTYIDNAHNNSINTSIKFIF